MAITIDKKFDKYQNLSFNAVGLKWAKCQSATGQFDQYSPPGMPKGEKKWTCQLVLNEVLATDLESKGFNVKKDKDGDWILPTSKKCNKADGSPNRPVVIVGKDGFTPIAVNLGNDTVANVKCSARKWPTTQKITVYLEGIQVLDLVEHASLGFDNVEEGEEEENF